MNEAITAVTHFPFGLLKSHFARQAVSKGPNLGKLIDKSPDFAFFCCARHRFVTYFRFRKVVRLFLASAAMGLHNARPSLKRWR
jgi:hypothetical protein